MTKEYMADCEGPSFVYVPSWMPVAYYVTGNGPQANHFQIENFTGGFVRIDQQPGFGVPFWSDEADVEPGAKSNDDAAAWCKARAAIGWTSRLYTSSTNLDALRSACSGITGVYYRIANWSLNEVEAEAQIIGDVYGVQWASPSSNPTTLVPGTERTLAEANVDLSIVNTDLLLHTLPKVGT